MKVKLLIDVNKEDINWKITKFEIEKIILAIFSHIEQKNKIINISILLTNDKRLQELNYQFRNKNYTTNVLSFPSGEIANNILYLGDIAISFQKTKQEADALDISFNSHFTHLLVHGVLHLLDFDHENDSEASEMEGMEIKILNFLKIKNPYINAGN